VGRSALKRDAYAVLQVDRRAELLVIRAAYRALAKRYHPDGTAPDAVRMAELNEAFDHLKTPEARRLYDESGVVAVGPGRPQPQEQSWYDPWATIRDQMAGKTKSSSVIDFGKYQGWALKDVARFDPEYLRWLSRHSSGIRFRDQIAELLPNDPQVGRRGSAR
jgi:curved DNA-binding protein CbpA